MNIDLMFYKSDEFTATVGGSDLTKGERGWLVLDTSKGSATLYMTAEQMRGIVSAIEIELREVSTVCDHAGCDEPVKAKVTFTADDGCTTTDYLFCTQHSSLIDLLQYAPTLPRSIAVHQL